MEGRAGTDAPRTLVSPLRSSPTPELRCKATGSGSAYRSARHLLRASRLTFAEGTGYTAAPPGMTAALHGFSPLAGGREMQWGSVSPARDGGLQDRARRTWAALRGRRDPPFGAGMTAQRFLSLPPLLSLFPPSSLFLLSLLLLLLSLSLTPLRPFSLGCNNCFTPKEPGAALREGPTCPPSPGRPPKVQRNPGSRPVRPLGWPHAGTWAWQQADLTPGSSLTAVVPGSSFSPPRARRCSDIAMSSEGGYSVTLSKKLEEEMYFTRKGSKDSRKSSTPRAVRQPWGGAPVA